MRRGSVVALALLASGCLGVGADHERLGDEALARSDWSSAVSEYQAAEVGRGNAQLYAKLALAARKARRLREAAQAYRDLVADDPSRLDEAATGLDLVAEDAERANDASGLGAAVTALHDVAPDRLAARHALALVRMGGSTGSELVAILPYAIAGAPDGGVTDSLLELYGNALRETTACEEAARSYQAVIRRSRDARLGTAARAGLAVCGVQLGQEARTVNDPVAAEKWLLAAVTADSAGLAGRKAWIGLGDLRRMQGDYLGAAMAYQAVLNVATNDSLGKVARARLDSISTATAVPDTSK